MISWDFAIDSIVYLRQVARVAAFFPKSLFSELGETAVPREKQATVVDVEGVINVSVVKGQLDCLYLGSSAASNVYATKS